MEKAICRRALAAAGAVALLVAACGSDRDDQGTSATAADAPDTTVASAEPTRSAGCEEPSSTTDVVDDERSAPVPGGPRRYLVTAPASIEPLPLVLDLHAYGGTPEEQARTSRAGSVGLEEGFIVATPEGSGFPLTWRVGGSDSPDVAVLDTIVDAVAAVHCVDLRRVYAMGFASGGIMAAVLACSAADRIAAVAVVSGMAAFEGCDPSRPVPMLGVHGTGDPVLLFNGGVGDASYLQDGTEKAYVAPPGQDDLDGAGMPETARTWAGLQGCDEATATDEHLADDVIGRTFDCPAGAAMSFVIVEGGGRAWPGSDHSAARAATFGPTTMDWNATREAWAWFEDVRLPA